MQFAPSVLFTIAKKYNPDYKLYFLNLTVKSRILSLYLYTLFPTSRLTKQFALIFWVMLPSWLIIIPADFKRK